MHEHICYFLYMIKPNSVFPASEYQVLDVLQIKIANWQSLPIYYLQNRTKFAEQFLHYFYLRF